MHRAPDVDGMFVGEPEDAVTQLATLESLDASAQMPSLTWRRDGADRSAPRARQLHRVPPAASPAWDLLDLKQYSLPLVDKPYVHRRNEPRLPVLVRLLRRANPPGPQVPGAKPPRRWSTRSSASIARRHRLLLLVGRHGHAQRQVVHRVLRRADRAQLADPAGSATREPTTSRIRRSCTGCAAPAAGCWRSASSPSPTTCARTW